MRTFYIDSLPEAHLVTAAEPQEMLWNGWQVPNPTPRELIKYLDDVRPYLDEEEWWNTLSAFMSAYGNDRHDDDNDCGLDDTTGFYMGFTWVELR